MFHAVNVNKRGVTLDLTTPEGVDLLERLVGTADVLVENYTPRVMDQFGLGWDRLHEVNPRLVMVRMPAFGLDGPWRDRRVTPDGHLLGRCEGEASFKAFLGASEDLLRNIHGVASVAELDGDEIGYLVGRVAEIKRQAK